MKVSKEDTCAVLVAARNLLASPSAWTTLTSARNADADSVLSDDPAAVCWCASGAIGRVIRTQFEVSDAVWPSMEWRAHYDRVYTRMRAANAALEAAMPADDKVPVAAYNDAAGRTYEEILELFYTAIMATAP